MTAPRTAVQRKRDTLHRLDTDIDCWVATAGAAGGAPYLIPLSFFWDGDSLLVATPAASPTGRNLRDSAQVRVAIGPTRDVVLIEGDVTDVVPALELPEQVAAGFAARTGFEPRELSGYQYFRIWPRRVQAWRESDELEGRDLMRGGRWLVAD